MGTIQNEITDPPKPDDEGTEVPKQSAYVKPEVILAKLNRIAVGPGPKASTLDRQDTMYSGQDSATSREPSGSYDEIKAGVATVPDALKEGSETAVIS